MSPTSSARVSARGETVGTVLFGLIILGATFDGIICGDAAVVAFVWGLILLLVVHEAGHYTAARATGIGVTEVGIGFGPPVAHWRTKKLSWWVRLVPLGAYVRIRGMTRKPDPRDEEGPGTSYIEASFLRQTLVALGGPIANIVLALVLLFVATVGAKVQAQWLLVHSVTKGSPAAAAGLVAGERIMTVDGQPGTQIGAVAQKSGGAPLYLVVADHSHDRRLAVTPEWDRSARSWRVGVVVSGGTVSAGVGKAASLSATEIFEGMGETVTGTAEAFSPGHLAGYAHLVGGARVSPAVAADRPVSIVGITRLGVEAAEFGWRSLLDILAVFSLAIGIFNALPVLPLDGGHVAAAVARRVTRRWSERRRELWRQVGVGISAAGAVVIVIVVAGAMWLDFVRPIRLPGVR